MMRWDRLHRLKAAHPSLSQKHRSSTRPEEQLTVPLEVLDQTSRVHKQCLYSLYFDKKSKKNLDAHRLSFISEYIFCKCFPHKILAVDLVHFCACDRFKHELVRHTV